MKYVLLVPDGAADLVMPELGDRTPLEVARTPYLDDIASRGRVGMVQVTPPDMYPGSDAANMALLGYDPAVYYTGRGPVEAAAMQVPMDPRDVAFRCSLCSTDGEKLTDYSSGHISTIDARPIIELAQKLCSIQQRLFPGIQYRHILRWADGPLDLRTVPPHENVNRVLADILPVGEAESMLRRFIYDSIELLDNIPYNRRRRAEGLAPANLLWPWGQGRAPSMPTFFKSRQLSGAVVAEVDVVKGLGRLTGLEVVDVPGATGFFDTDYYAMGRYAVSALERHDFVMVHVEAPDEAGHVGSIDEKIKAIECIDQYVVGTMLDRLKSMDDFRILVSPDHMTPISTRGHKVGPVPFLLFDSRENRKNTIPFDERAERENVLFVEEGYRLMEMLLKS